MAYLSGVPMKLCWADPLIDDLGRKLPGWVRDDCLQLQALTLELRLTASTTQAEQALQAL